MNLKEKEFRRKIINYEKGKEVIIDKIAVQKFKTLKKETQKLKDGPTSEKIDMIIEIGEEVIRYLESIYGENLRELKLENGAILEKIYEMINNALKEVEKANKEQHILMSDDEEHGEINS